MKAWPFADPENVAVLTLRDIMDRKTCMTMGSEADESGANHVEAERDR